MAVSEINITIVNCNGLGTNPKRIRVLKWLKHQFKGILLLQETHTTKKIEPKWKMEIGTQYEPYFSHGKSNKRGVCTIIPRGLVKSVIKTEEDEDGRYLLVQIEINKTVYTIVNVYFPTQEFVTEQIQTLEALDFVC